MDALVVFYSAPRGQKILNEMPATTSEAMQAASWNYAKTYDEYDTACSKEIVQAQKTDETKTDEVKSPTGRFPRVFIRVFPRPLV